MVDSRRCIDCRAPIVFTDKRATCPDCGLRMYLADTGGIGREPGPDSFRNAIRR